MAVTRRRAMPRAIIIVARFAQAMTSTITTAPKTNGENGTRAHIVRPIGTNHAENGRFCANWAVSLYPTWSSSTLAASTLAPDLSLRMDRKPNLPPPSVGAAASGIQMPVSNGKCTPRGMTPITV